MPIEYDKRKLPVQLSDEELNSRRDDLAKANLDLNQLVQEKSQQSSGFNARIKETKNRIAELAQQISSRQKFDDVEVEDQRDEEKFMINTVRLDTNTVIASRAMTTAERQMQLPNLATRRRRAEATPTHE